MYIPEVLYKMRVGGVSNRNWAKIRQKMQEELLAIRRNRVGGLRTLVFKNLSKVRQCMFMKIIGSWAQVFGRHKKGDGV